MEIKEELFGKHDENNELELVSDCCGAKVWSIYDDEPMCSDCCNPCDEVTQDEIKQQTKD